MSDIPIGSPPAPPGRHAAPQGWYPDPVDPARERYWDGWSWTRNTRAAESAQRTGAPKSSQQGQNRAPYAPYGQQSGASAVPPTAGAPGPQTDDGVPLAGWGWRLLAGIGDLILVGIITFIASIHFYLKMVPVISDYVAESMAAAERGEIASPLEPSELMPSAEDQMWMALIATAVGVLYFALFWRFKAATPMQLLVGLRVVGYGRGRSTERLGWAPVILRALLWSVPFAVGSLLLIFGLINALSPLWNPNRQALHDLAARTQVVKIR